MSAKIMPIEFEDEFYTIDIDSPRPRFMSPKPTSPNRKPVLRHLAVRSTSPLPSALGKRDFIIAFGDDAEEQRYGQKIDGDFFATNVGHGVFLPLTAEKKPLTVEELQGATDRVIQDFWVEFAGLQRRERDSESKYDVDELLAWCEYYSKNRNLFNV